MPIVNINGTRIAYWLGNQGFSRKGEIILFIHGAGGNQLIWSFQKAFFEKDFIPIVIELPGHGNSEGDGRDEISLYAKDVLSFMRELRLQRIFMVGHSMGGAIVQTIALSHPELIRGIVLVGTGARLRVPPMILERIKTHFEEMIPKLVNYAYSRKTSKELIEQGIKLLMQCKPHVLYNDFLACDRFDKMRDVEEIGLPTLIICGAEDELTPIKYSKYLREKIKRSALEIISDTGHMVMIESPSEFNNKIREFILDLRNP